MDFRASKYYAMRMLLREAAPGMIIFPPKVRDFRHAITTPHRRTPLATTPIISHAGNVYIPT